MTRVFLSYKRDDVQFAEFVRQKLIEWGYQVWMDIHDIPKGAYWPDAIDEALRKTDLVVGVMSPDAVASRNVKNEWDWALVNEKPVLLLMLRETQIPVNYISINYIDFRGDRTAGLKHLQEALLSAFTGAYQLSPEKIAAMPKPDEVRKEEPEPSAKDTVRRVPLQKPAADKPRFGLTLPVILAIGFIGLVGLAGVIVFIALLISATNGNGNSTNNAERFISAIGAGDIASAREYVCDSQRSTLPDTFHAFWIGQGAWSLTEPSCSGNSDSLTCWYTVLYNNGISQNHQDTFIMEDNLICDIQ